LGLLKNLSLVLSLDIVFSRKACPAKSKQTEAEVIPEGAESWRLN
jgi:hypothetical protein